MIRRLVQGQSNYRSVGRPTYPRNMYDVLTTRRFVASALTAGNAEVNGAASITTNGGAVDLSFADADSLLNGNGTAPAQTGSVAADVTVTGTISMWPRWPT